MRYLLFILCGGLLFSCSDSFINHKLDFEKKGVCSDRPRTVKMLSNINGERYLFPVCMDEDFNGKGYTVERKGDSILVNFPKTTGKKQVSFDLVLDIDAKPRYGHIVLDGTDVTVVPYYR